MAITKPSRSMLSTGISDSSDATFLTADSSENATFAGNLTVSGNLTVTGTTTQVDTVTMNAQNAVLFEGATADAHETTLTTVDPTGDRTISLPNVSGTLPVLAAASATAITSTPAELNLLDGSVANTVVNSKAMIYGSGGEVAAGGITATSLTVNGGAIFNEGSADADFRVESNGNANMLFVDGGNDKIGIGTNAPAEQLHVLGDSAKIQIESNGSDTGVQLVLDGAKTSNGAIGDIVFENAGDTVGMIRSSRASANDAADMLFYTQVASGSNAEKMRITSTGNVHIGNSTTGFHASVAPLIVGSGSGDEGMAIFSGNASKGKLGFADAATDDSGSYRGYIQYDHNVDKMNIGTAGSTRMAIFGDGSGQFYGSWALEDNKKLQLGASADLQIWHDGSDSYIRDDGTGNLLIQSSGFYFGDASGNHRMRLDTGSDPELRLGTTNDYSSTFVAYCDHATDASITAESNTDSFTGEVFVASSTRNTANATYRLIQAQRRGNSVVFTVNDAGNAQNTNNSFTGISDERLKINIEDASSQWDDIKALRVRKYQWGHGNTGHTQIGLVSQEVEAAGMPHLIEESPADEYQIKYNPALEGENVKTMKYSVLYMKAVKALQEAQLRIENLEAENSKLVDLEKRMETIEQRLI